MQTSQRIREGDGGGDGGDDRGDDDRGDDDRGSDDRGSDGGGDGGGDGGSDDRGGDGGGDGVSDEEHEDEQSKNRVSSRSIFVDSPYFSSASLGIDGGDGIVEHSDKSSISPIFI